MVQIGISWLFLMGYLILLKGIFLFASLNRNTQVKSTLYCKNADIG